jgi:hypothetical protein
MDTDITRRRTEEKKRLTSNLIEHLLTAEKVDL